MRTSKLRPLRHVKISIHHSCQFLVKTMSISNKSRSNLFRSGVGRKLQIVDLKLASAKAGITFTVRSVQPFRFRSESANSLSAKYISSSKPSQYQLPCRRIANIPRENNNHKWEGYRDNKPHFIRTFLTYRRGVIEVSFLLVCNCIVNSKSSIFFLLSSAACYIRFVPV